VIVLDWDAPGVAAMRFLVLHHFVQRGRPAPVILLADRAASPDIPRHAVTRVLHKPVSRPALEDAIARIVVPRTSRRRRRTTLVRARGAAQPRSRS
jgi:hypothetical protein